MHEPRCTSRSEEGTYCPARFAMHTALSTHSERTFLDKYSRSTQILDGKGIFERNPRKTRHGSRGPFGLCRRRTADPGLCTKGRLSSRSVSHTRQWRTPLTGALAPHAPPQGNSCRSNLDAQLSFTLCILALTVRQPSGHDFGR